MLNAPYSSLDGNGRPSYAMAADNPLGRPRPVQVAPQSLAVQKWPRPFSADAFQFRAASQTPQTTGAEEFRWGAAPLRAETLRSIPTGSRSGSGSKSGREGKQPLLPTFQDTSLPNATQSRQPFAFTDFDQSSVWDTSQVKQNDPKGRLVAQPMAPAEILHRPGRKGNDSDPSKVPGLAEDKGQSKTKSDDQSRFTGSKMISVFKITSALIVTGGMNAFLFGVPIYIASGLAVMVAGSQALTALKIHKEDTPFTRKMLGFTRKLMGRENDLTPAGKEWSMVPVWAAICGTFGLSEALGNHLYKKFTGYQPKDFQQQSTAIQEAINNSGNGFKRGILNWQLKGMTSVNNAKHKLSVTLERRAAQGGTVGGLLNRAFKKVMASSGGKKPGFAYLWSFCMASFAGATQTAIAALMQQKIDQAHGVRKPE